MQDHSFSSSVTTLPVRVFAELKPSFLASSLKRFATFASLQLKRMAKTLTGNVVTLEEKL